MSLDQFGLHHPPFRPQGSDGSVYAGSQQIALAGGLKRALASPDAVITVSGEVGVGKTTSVRYALSRLGATSAVARIGRVHLGREEVLDVLLDEFKVANKPASALQRYNALQRLLRNWADVGTRVFVVVEDVERLGADALAEIESLTAADSDDEPGAHLILMGGPKLRKFLKSPTLARLKQRVRRSLVLDPFTADETRAYIAHQIHEAGGDATTLFDNAAVDVVHACSNGIARVINTVSEAMLYQAEDIGAPKVTAVLAFDVAREDFDYDGERPGADAREANAEAPGDPSDDPSQTSVEASEAAPVQPEAQTDAAADLASPADVDSHAAAEASDALTSDPAADGIAAAAGEGPDLIQDTNPGVPAIDP
ncbi:MAG: AAA family ATPase, partial [Pseudomonadota bacterium]